MDRALAARHGLQPVLETARMCAGGALALPLQRIYGITSLELGEAGSTHRGDHDLDPRVLNVEHAAGEAMPREQVAQHHVERHARAGGR